MRLQTPLRAPAGPPCRSVGVVESVPESAAPFAPSVAPVEEQNRFVRALSSGWDALVSATAVIVTEPLTADERWNALAPGELAVFRDGARIH